jgi:hypothetical protein
METTKDLREYLAGLKKAKDDRREAQANLEEATRVCREAFVPLGQHPTADVIHKLHTVCPEDNVFPGPCILVCLALLWYAPDALFGGRLPMRLARTLAAELQVKPEAVYIQRNKVAAWLRIYPEFIDLVSELFARTAADALCRAFE